MSRKIGELLIDKGLITQDQLERALRAQLILGGHLGTCLVEAGFLDEDALGETLAEVFRVPYAPAARLREVPAPVLRILPRRLVEEYRVVPLVRNEKSLEVAMINPRDLQAQDGLAFAAGCRIVPWVAPEVRVLEAMERHYGIPRGFRYITICRTMDGLPPTGTTEAARRDHVQPAPPALGGAESGAEAWDPDSTYGYGRSWMEIADELEGTSRELTDVDLPERSPGAPAVRAERPAAPVGIAERLCRSETTDDVAGVVLDALSGALKRCALFTVRGEIASIWETRGLPRDDDGAPRAARFSVTSGGLFDLLLGNEFYRGPLGDGQRGLDFFRALGVDPPAELLLVPVHLNDRLVALFYGDGGTEGAIEGGTSDCLRVMRMLSFSLSLIIVKKKIRAVEAFAPAAVLGEGAG